MVGYLYSNDKPKSNSTLLKAHKVEVAHKVSKLLVMHEKY